jgi:hypothetical protein
MDFSPSAISSSQAEAECARHGNHAPSANASALRRLKSQPLSDSIIHMLSRLAFRGIYFPQMSRKDWAGVFFQNRSSILGLIAQALMVKVRAAPRGAS